MAFITGGVMLAGAAISAGAGIYAADKSAKATERGAQIATDAQERMYNQTREDFAPQRQLGYDAITTLNRLYGYGGGSKDAPLPQPITFNPGGLKGGLAATMGRIVGRPPVTIDGSTGKVVSGKPDMSVFFESPDYQFNLAEGQKAIDRSAAARGGLLSGRAVKEGQRYASGLASREYAGFVDRLMQQAGLGSTGIGATSAAGSNAANNISMIAQNAGNARASAYGMGAQAVNNAVQGGFQNLLLSRYLSPGG